MKSITILLIFITFFTTAQTVRSYVVIAETSNNYFELEEKMKKLSHVLNIKVDLQNKDYHKEKNLICLPDDDEDETYAGLYYPRRYTSNTLSIEYLNYYDNSSSEKIMALVIMISGDKKEAKKRLQELKPHSEKGFLIKAENLYGVYALTPKTN